MSSNIYTNIYIIDRHDENKVCLMCYAVVNDKWYHNTYFFFLLFLFVFFSGDYCMSVDTHTQQLFVVVCRSFVEWLLNTNGGWQVKKKGEERAANIYIKHTYRCWQMFFFQKRLVENVAFRFVTRSIKWS